MLTKIKPFSNFSRAIKTLSPWARPQNELHMQAVMANTTYKELLIRGNGMSYSDCCVNHNGLVVDGSLFNHLLAFDQSSGILICEGGVSFADLFLVHPDFIPPVIPGTLHATLAGGVANDIHGKNNHGFGSLGHHVKWLDIQIGDEIIHCSPASNSALFYASIGGLGLTGFIKRIAIQLHKASRFLSVQTMKYDALDGLPERMQQHGVLHDYQVAWLDLLNKPRALLSMASHTNERADCSSHRFTIPRLPFSLVSAPLMKKFNAHYFNKKIVNAKTQSLPHFNNPLDSLRHWNRLYGKKGLLQFQAVFASNNSSEIIKQLLNIIHASHATPTLAVLKYFTQHGPGLLSFTQPGFTLAIDFINNAQAKKAIRDMNQFITETGGKIYLAKDLFLTPQQFETQYPNYQQFMNVLSDYKSTLRSDLSQRLGLSS